MKYFLAIALIAAVASAGVVKPTAAVAEIQQIVQAINSPSTDPATAVVLEALLEQMLVTEPISIAPAFVDFHPIAVGPAIVAPVVPGPVNIVDQAENIDVSPAAVIGPAFVDFEDAIVQPAAETTAPLVQIILNINQAAAAAPVVVPAGAATVVEEHAVVPGPVNIVEQPISVSPVQVAEPIVPGPVNIVDGAVAPVIVEPVQVGSPILPIVVEPVQVGSPILPIVVEPVQVGAPILPMPAVVLPEELN